MEVLKHDSAFDDGDLKDLGDDTIVVTSEQAAQFSSIINIGAMVGALIAGVSCDVLGRRSTILLIAPIFAGMWIWTATTTSYAQLIVARVTTGVAVGVVSMATPLYISETAPTNLRGSLGSVNQVSEVVVHPILYCLSTRMKSHRTQNPGERRKLNATSQYLTYMPCAMNQ